MPSDRQAISKLAYQLWQTRGSPHGSAESDWSEAERQLAAQAREATLDEALNEPPAGPKKKRRTAAAPPKGRKS